MASKKKEQNVLEKLRDIIYNTVWFERGTTNQIIPCDIIIVDEYGNDWELDNLISKKDLLEQIENAK